MLKVLYDEWLKEPWGGATSYTISQALKVEEDQLNGGARYLQENSLADITWESSGFIANITGPGIDTAEKSIDPIELQKRTEERPVILEKLYGHYLEKPHKDISKETLKAETNLPDDKLDAGAIYLSKQGLIDFYPAMAKYFSARLNSYGLKVIESREMDYSEPMSNAYVLLFKLEYKLRLFIENKLKEKYGSDWWEKGIPSSVKREAEGRKKDELEIGWQVSKDKSIINYIEFKDIDNIISHTDNWKIFEPYFRDLQNIKAKLNELEYIRNDIAHTRVLSDEGYNRLTSYFKEIMAMISKK